MSDIEGKAVRETALSGGLQIAMFFLVPVILMRIYGNSFGGRFRSRSESLRDQ